MEFRIYGEYKIKNDNQNNNSIYILITFENFHVIYIYKYLLWEYQGNIADS